MRAVVVLTTVGTEEQANRIAEELVERRLSCCVNIVPGIRSVYRWKGEICRDGEMMLVIKTSRELFPALAEAIAELHSYELPEILAFRVETGERRFLDWLEGCLECAAGAPEEEAEPSAE